MTKESDQPRVFKSAWFAKRARKEGITDSELRRAANEAIQGQSDDLGGGVFKKRLNDNRYRSIILAKSGRFWVFEFLFAKQDRANIDSDELRQFRRLADAYGKLTAAQLQQLLASKSLVEI